MSGVLRGRRIHRDTQRKEVHLKVEAEKKKKVEADGGKNGEEGYVGSLRLSTHSCI